MNGQQGAEQAAQNAQESHLAYLLNSANGQSGLMGYPGAAALAGVQRLGYGVTDATLEEQILQRASALRAEALMQQQQQAQQRQHHLGAALAALQQQQQLSSLSGLNPTHLAALSVQEQEALLNRASALRELGIQGGPGAALPAAALSGASIPGAGMERLQQLELGRLEELERRRQQLAALAGLSGSNGAGGAPRPGELASGSEQRGQESSKREPAASEVKCTPVPSEKSKEDLRKTPGTVIVPCRARGMPMDHNFKTAYFVISEDAKHGEDLVCSYFACRNGGVKFRYCAHCMAPVAKRNFCRRHDHGMSAKNGESKDDDDDDVSISLEGSDTNVKEDNEPAVSTKKSVETPPAPTSSLDVLSKAASSSLSSGASPKETEDESKRKKPAEEEEEEDSELASISIKRRKLWSALLVKRPKTKDPRHLSSWLNEVLTVSDLETNLDQSEALQAETPGSSKKRKASKEEGPGFKKEKKSNGEKKKKRHDSEKSDSKIKKEKTEIKSKDSKKPSKSKESTEDDPPKDMMPDKVPPKISQTESKQGQSEVKESAKAMDIELTQSDKESSAPKVTASKASEDEKKTDDKSIDEVATGDNEKNSNDESSSGDKYPEKEDLKESTEKLDDEDGFARSFADWRDRKKEKALKKGPGSLKK